MIHLTAGFSSIIATLIIGKRRNTPQEKIHAHNIPFVLIGAGLLWFGWFGFNGGSAGASSSVAVQAAFNTQIGGTLLMLRIHSVNIHLCYRHSCHGHVRVDVARSHIYAAPQSHHSRCCHWRYCRSRDDHTWCWLRHLSGCSRVRLPRSCFDFLDHSIQAQIGLRRRFGKLRTPSMNNKSRGLTIYSN